MTFKLNSHCPKLVFLMLSAILVLILSACSPSIDQELATTPPKFNPLSSAPLPSSTSTSPAQQEDLSPTAVLSTMTETIPGVAATQGRGLHIVTGENGIISGKIRHLWVDPDGILWVGTDTGVFVHQEDEWEIRYEGGIEHILGADTNGKVWFILKGESGIAVYDLSQTWREYGPEQGWTVPPEIEYLSPGYGDGIVTDLQGRVWLATGRDEVRYYDPDSLSWQVLTATDLGFDPVGEEGYQGHFLSDVELSRNQRVWVGDCIGMGEGLQGQGVRWSDGESWFEIPDTLGECVQDIEKDAESKMWVAGFDVLLMYDPNAGYWTRFPLPTWERRQLITDITLDKSGNPWVEVLQYGGASPFGAVVRYHLVEAEWVKDFEGWFSSLAVGEDGVAWLCSEGRISRLENGRLEEIGDVPGSDCQIVLDGAGQVWVMNFSDLWWFEPQESN